MFILMFSIFVFLHIKLGRSQLNALEKNIQMTKTVTALWCVCRSRVNFSLFVFLSGEDPISNE